MRVFIRFRDNSSKHVEGARIDRSSNVPGTVTILEDDGDRVSYPLDLIFSVYETESDRD